MSLLQLIKASRKWIGLIAIAAGVVLTVYWLSIVNSQLHELSQYDSPFGVDERLTNVEPSKAPWLIETNGGRWGKYGWYLNKSESGSLRISLPSRDSGYLKLRTWIYNPGEVRVHVSDSVSTYEISESNGRFVDLPVHGKSQLLITASNHISEDQLVFDRFAAVWIPYVSELPALWPLCVGVMIILMGWGLLLRSVNSMKLWLGTSAIVALSVFGLLLRWNDFDVARNLSLRADTIAYVSYARTMDWFTVNHGFYSGSFPQREPLFIATLNLWSRLFGWWQPSVKLLTVCLSTVLISASGFFAWRLSKRWFFGGLMALIMAVNPAVVKESVQGLRTEAETVLFLAVVSVWLWGKGRIGSVLLGGTIGATSLLLVPEGLYVFIPLIWLCWLLNVIRSKRGSSLPIPSQWNFKQLLAASIIAIILYIPHLYGLHRNVGNISQPTQLYARWLANSEFQDRLGTPGFPTREEFTQSSYAGPPISIGEYFFGLHSVPTLIKGQIKGWILSNAYMSVSLTPHIVEYAFLYEASGLYAALRHLSPLSVFVFVIALILTLVGWIDLWRSLRYWWVPFLTLWGTWFTAYIYSARLVEPFRHTAYVYPLLVFCMIWGGWKVYLYFCRIDCIKRIKVVGYADI